MHKKSHKKANKTSMKKVPKKKISKPHPIQKSHNLLSISNPNAISLLLPKAKRASRK
jgi:hypothetical protein